MKTVAKCIRGDYIACVRFEDDVHLQYFAILSGGFIPSREHFLQVFFDNRFDSTDAGIGKEAVDAVSPHAVHIVIYRGDDGIRG